MLCPDEPFGFSRYSLMRTYAVPDGARSVWTLSCCQLPLPDVIAALSFAVISDLEPLRKDTLTSALLPLTHEDCDLTHALAEYISPGSAEMSWY
jgi:hypothetical protein